MHMYSSLSEEMQVSKCIYTPLFNKKSSKQFIEENFFQLFQKHYLKGNTLNINGTLDGVYNSMAI